jgi:lambda family phage portal protein
MIIHLMESERAEQRRGVPFLAPVIECLKQITRYTEAELMAAVVSGMFTIFIKSPDPDTGNTMGSMVPPDQQLDQTEPNTYEMGNGAINILQPGEDVQAANPTRPNANFDGFVNSLAAQVGAALEIPKELLLKMFTASYSASRAALLEAWKMFRMRRTWLANDFCQPIFERWLAEAIARGRISAPGFWSDPLVRKAWCRAEWNGPAPGQIDPLKEVQAAQARVNGGFSTRERETMELTGGDFDRNIPQLRRENELMKGAGLNVQSSSAGQAAVAGDPNGAGDGGGNKNNAPTGGESG